jgi:integrase/recombinase XerD
MELVQQSVTSLFLSGRPATTTRLYSADLGKFVQFIGKDLLLATPFDVQGFLDSIDSPVGAERALKVIRSFFSFAVKVGALQRNPAIVAKVVILDRPVWTRILTEIDVQRIMLELQRKDGALGALLYGTGLRRSEAVAVNINDIREVAGGAVLTVIGKGGKARQVVLSSWVWVAVKAQMDAVGEGCLFQGRQGALSDSQIYRRFKEAAVAAGLPHVSPHWFRHSHVSHALDNGCPVHVVQQSVGHASLATTTAYAHVKPSSSPSSYLRDLCGGGCQL